MRIAALCASIALYSPALAGEWQPLFDGKSLEDWEGDNRLWRVENGILTGETDDQERKIAANSFLIRKQAPPGDFELEFEARVTGNNNSGVQYRSERPKGEGWILRGYQLDLHPARDYLAMLYEERGRGIACLRGQKVRLAAKPETIGSLEVAVVKLGEWNRYRVEARGNILKHYVNDRLAAEIEDVSEQHRRLEGLIGLQLHAGPPMKAEFRALRLRPLTATPGQIPEDQTSAFEVAPGFRLERIYAVPPEQGSWVAMTVRADGQFYCADQYGEIHLVSPVAGPERRTHARSAGIPLGGAHGLLWHEGVLWVSVNEDGGKRGVWRVTDSNGDGEPDQPTLVRALNGGGEHGPHALVASPDGKWIYLVCGNHTDLPEFDSSVLPRVWAEDQLLPRRPDARGHAADRMAPGGWVARISPDGAHWQLFAAGFRNAYDLAFHESGDLFTYDSDMEWDLGMPWYRPTRICHVTPGAEFGWRHGTGKWPEIYEDSMPSQYDIGPGSPTGMVSGQGARFPERYQRALFAFDWTFATIHALHLSPQGGGHIAERENFIAGSGLPLTDGAIGKDGALYFLTGGRKSGSALWRVSHPESEQNQEIKLVPYHAKTLEPLPPDAAQTGLGSSCRITRHQARVALEHRGADALRPLLPNEKRPWAVIHLVLGLARCGEPSDRENLLTALQQLDWQALDIPQQINWLRAAGLVFLRLGPPGEDERQQILTKIDPAFPARDPRLNRELCRMLAFLEAPGVIGRSLALMETAGPGAPPDWHETAGRNAHYGGTVRAMIANLPPAEVIHFLYCLRTVRTGWTNDERKRFFAWFPRLATRSGGMSYAGFITDLKNEALALVPQEERAHWENVASSPPVDPFANLPKATGPGREWTHEDITRIAAAGLADGNRENGKKMFQAALCATCHRFGGEGGASGPDLSALAGRFSVSDLATALLDPSAEISDQYEFHSISLADGSSRVGRILREENDHLVLAPNAFDFSQTLSLAKADIRAKAPSPVSPMPGGLIHMLNESELRDLLSYLLQTTP